MDGHVLIRDKTNCGRPVVPKIGTEIRLVGGPGERWLTRHLRIGSFDHYGFKAVPPFRFQVIVETPECATFHHQVQFICIHKTDRQVLQKLIKALRNSLTIFFRVPVCPQ